MKTYEEILSALGDPTRRRIFELLRDGARPVGRIASELPVSRPAVSQHLKVLREAGLVQEEVRGTRHIYHLRSEGLLPLREYIEGFWGSALASFATYVARDKGESA